MKVEIKIFEDIHEAYSVIYSNAVTPGLQKIIEK